MVKIDKIQWLSEDAKEAEVFISDGNFNIICFSQPFCQMVGDEVSLPLYTLNATEVYNVNRIDAFLVEKMATAFGYKFTGCVIDKENHLMKVGEFIIQLDINLPSYVEVGCYITIVCDRLDIY